MALNKTLSCLDLTLFIAVNKIDYLDHACTQFGYPTVKNNVLYFKSHCQNNFIPKRAVVSTDVLQIRIISSIYRSPLMSFLPAR